MSELIFKEDTHQYFIGEKELISSSTLVGVYSPQFDKTGEITRRCAEKQGKTEDELRAEWDKKCDDAAIRGKNFHSQAEHWVKTGKIQNKDYKDVVKQLSKFEFKGKLIPERRVANLDLGIAGTIDLTEKLEGNTINIFDYKTNLAIKRRGFFRKGQGFEKMLYPINHLENCNWIHYSLQIQLYKIIEEENGAWVQDTELFYIPPKTRIIERYPTLDLEHDAWNLINHYYSRPIKPRVIEKVEDGFGF